MSGFSSLLKKFHDSILDKNPEIAAPEIKANGALSPEKRMEIYIDAYRIRLLQTIRADYPEALKLISDAEFDRIAGLFIEKNPPEHFNLDSYPQRFAEFFSQHPSDALACEIAALEAAISEVFLLPDSEVLRPEDMQNIAAEDFANLKLALRSAGKLLAFNYPANAYLTAARKGESPVRPKEKPSWVYVCRHENEVRRADLHETEFLVLQKLAAGANAGEAIESIADMHERHSAALAENLQSWLANWLAGGYFRK